MNDSVRAATIVCTKNSHFAVMCKADYEKVLRKIELKTQVKLVNFLKQIPYLQNWTYKMIINLSYYLTVKSYPMGHIVYKEGQSCEEIAIVKQGTFELSKHLPPIKEDKND